MQKVTNSSIKINKLKLCAQLILLGIVFFFVFDKGIIRDLKPIFDMFDMRNVDKVLTYFVLPFKTFYDLSQLVTFTYFVLKVILCAVIVPLLILALINSIKFLHIEKNKNNFSLKNFSAKNFAPVYIVQQKFLC